MNPFAITSLLINIGASDNNKKFQEAVITSINGIFEKLNGIINTQNTQIQEISQGLEDHKQLMNDTLVRFEYYQYMIIGIMFVALCIFGYTNFVLWRKVQRLEIKG